MYPLHEVLLDPPALDPTTAEVVKALLDPEVKEKPVLEWEDVDAEWDGWYRVGK